MKLISVRVQKFRNILDSSLVEIHPNITCFVGKNESGKTAFLQALYRLNPARPNVAFSVHDHYPAWIAKKDRLRGGKPEEFVPIYATFKLEDDDTRVINEKFGSNVLQTTEISVGRNYKGEEIYDISVNEHHAIENLLSKLSFPAEISEKAHNASSFSDLDNIIEKLQAHGEEHAEELQAGKALQSAVNHLVGDQELVDAVYALLKPSVPQFFYFSDYSELPYTVKIRDVLTADPNSLSDDLLTARSLLRLAAADNDYLLNPDYERRKRELENVANAMTDDVRKYWTQNPELRVLPDITQRAEPVSNGQQIVIDELKIRIWDERQALSLPFDEHSTGFQWFFSFLAAFSEYEYKDVPIVILLDEPALGLHARAQADFLRFIEERLSQRCQVLYTTHSPFMVQPGKLERVRVVEDRGRDEGSKVTKDVLTIDKDTLFPLQGALGYDLAQHLFIAPHNLVVEGSSDYTYLLVISDFLKEQGKTHIDERWSIIPVGGADAVPTFVALLGSHLEVTVLVDSTRGGNQRLNHLANSGYLSQTRIIMVGEIIGKSPADIEDLFTTPEYLTLYNRVFGTQLTEEQIPGTDPVVSRIARHLGVSRFDHGKPADVLLRHRDELLPILSNETLTRFEQLIERINSTLGT